MEKKKIDLFKGLMDAEIHRVRKDATALYDAASAFLSVNDYDGFMDKITSFVSASKAANYLESLKSEVLSLVEPASVNEEALEQPNAMEELMKAVDKLYGENVVTNNVD